MAPPATRFVVVLVAPKFGGNVGSVARAMRNLGFDELWLVGSGPEALGDDARRMAMHAWDILDHARSFATLEEARRGLDLLVGTSSDLALNEKRDYIRVPLRAREFAERVHELRGAVGLVFGPEDFGLSNDDLALCDLLVTIPSNPEHPSLNLSHAAAILLYELAQAKHPVKRPRAASREETEKMLEFVDRMLVLMDLPEHRRKTTLLSFRKMLGRAMMSKWEYHRIMGLFSAAVASMEQVREEGKRVRHVRRARQEAARRASGARKR